MQSIVEEIYQHPDINRLIGNLKPVELQNDLKQELAVILLEMPSTRLQSLYNNGLLVSYSLRTCWLMCVSKTSKFYYQYRKSDNAKAFEYLAHLQPGGLPLQLADIAGQFLTQQPKSIYDDHEKKIFTKFVELGSRRKVAEYFGIPINHVCRVVNKVQSELKCLLKQ